MRQATGDKMKKQKKLTRKVINEILILSGFKLKKVEDDIYWLKVIDDPGSQEVGIIKENWKEFISDLKRGLITDLNITEDKLNEHLKNL